jgi:uncharacterized protein
VDDDSAAAYVELADYRRRVHDMYAAARAGGGSVAAWEAWRAARDHLFATHRQSALEPGDRLTFSGLAYHPHDPTARVDGRIHSAAPLTMEIAHSAAGTTRFVRIGTVAFELAGATHTLDLYWLDAYGGGLFLPFRDRTAATTSYGGGRYLLDTVKGADLGGAGSALVLDFNYAYHPSCVYSPRWSCPLAPPGNRIDAAVTAGERSSAP